MRALRTAQPRRACDTTVFSCANRGDGVPGQWPPIIAWPVPGGCVAVSLSHRAVCGQLTSFQPNVRRYGAFLRDPGQVPLPILAQRSRVRTAHMGPHRPDIFPRRSAGPESPVPGPTSVHETGATTRVPWTLAGRVPSGARWSSSLCASAQWRVCTSQWRLVRVSRLETITNVYTRSQYVIYWLSQLELPPLEITWARL